MAGKTSSANRQTRRKAYAASDRRGQNKLRRVRKHCRAHPADKISASCLKSLGGTV